MRAPALGLLTLAAVWLAGLAATDDVTALLLMVPVFALLLPLAARHYLLEDALVRLRGARRLRRRVAPAVRLYAPRPRSLPAWLLEICTGTRGPPAWASTQSSLADLRERTTQ